MKRNFILVILFMSLHHCIFGMNIHQMQSSVMTERERCSHSLCHPELCQDTRHRSASRNSDRDSDGFTHEVAVFTVYAMPCRSSLTKEQKANAIKIKVLSENK